MKRAIISGATGLVGMAVSKYLFSNGIDTLCLGRKALSTEDICRNFGAGARYLRVAMEEIASLPDRVDLMTWSPGAECVFFNFAWRGNEKLAYGSFGDQVNNTVHAAEAVRSAKKMGCLKFVNAGTLEESFVEQFLAEKSKQPYRSTQTEYALAKLASRDMCKMVAYLEKIDYVHTRMSVPLIPDLSRGAYVAATLKTIAEGKSYEAPTSKQLFDIVFIDDLARAYFLIGLSGKNKADYFIGTARPATLGQYFERFVRIVNGNYSDEPEMDMIDEAGFFSNRDLYQDTGFIASTRLQDIVENVRNP